MSISLLIDGIFYSDHFVKNTLIPLVLFLWHILWPLYLVVLEVSSGTKGTEKKKVLKNVTALAPTIQQVPSGIQNSNPYLRNSRFIPCPRHSNLTDEFSWFSSIPHDKSTWTIALLGHEHFFSIFRRVYYSLPVHLIWSRVQLKCDGTQWRTGREVKGKQANRVGCQYPSHYLGTWCI